MKNIDFERFHNDFNLYDFLTEPVGRFNRNEMRDILNICTNPKGIALMAGFYGIRQEMMDELVKVRDAPQWKKKINLLREAEAQEIYCRIWLKESIKAQYKVV